MGMVNKGEIRPKILALDAGGSMTDSFVVDEKGNFYIGKARTTPEDESRGIIESFNSALKDRISLKKAFEELELVVYTGTIMLNRILTREGLKPLGIITTAGFEDILEFGRAKQCWTEYSYDQRLHAVSHRYPEPIITKEYIYGVRERILPSGYIMIPLFENDVEMAVEKLINTGVKAIIICFLFSYINSIHEKKARKIAKKVLRKRRKEIPVFISSDVCPIHGETGRLNTMVLHAYAAEPSRSQLKKLRTTFKEYGSNASLRVLTSYGTTVSADYKQLIYTLTSGPTGGVIGVKYLSDIYGFQNVVGTDIGGTSFDVAVIVGGRYTILPETSIARFIVNIPMIAIHSIGAGTGSFILFDPITERVKISSKSASYRIGVSLEGSGVERVTINDVMLILGYLNPDYLLGGKLKLNRERAISKFERQIAKPTKIDIYEAAEGVYNLICLHIREYLNSQIVGLGFSPENFHLISYGGGGPLMVAGYTEKLNFQDILIPKWATVFSAFGVATADYGIRHEKSCEIRIPGPRIKEMSREIESNESKWDVEEENIIEQINYELSRLKKAILEEVSYEKLDTQKIIYIPMVRMKYFGMLDDFEIKLSSMQLEKGDFNKLLRRFDDQFDKIYARGIKSPELGYEITRIILVGVYPTSKPKIKEKRLGGKELDDEAYKGTREIYWNKEWHEANIINMGKVKPGNVIIGPAVIESPESTFLIPPTYGTYLDKYDVYHLLINR